MKVNRTPPKSARHVVDWAESDFLFAASLKEATACAAPPAHLYKRVPWQRGAVGLAAAVFAVGAGFSAFYQWVYPPALVREAMYHEHRESTLRGDFQSDKRPMLAAMGLRNTAPLPGLLQLQRPCEIVGRKAYHLTTFIEHGGGIVTILAFAEPLADVPTGYRGHGQWLGQHWRFAVSKPGKTILLLADNAKVLTEVEAMFNQT